jgi:hypothetical protein
MNMKTILLGHVVARGTDRSRVPPLPEEVWSIYT